MRTLLLPLAVLLVAGAASSDGAKQDLDKLQGKWVMAAEVVGGVEVPAEKLLDKRLEIKGNKYRFESPATGGEHGTFALDPAKRPRAIDFTPAEGPNQGKTRQAIYEVSDGTLKFCVDPLGQRPAAFASPPGGKTVLITFRRPKKS